MLVTVWTRKKYKKINRPKPACKLLYAFNSCIIELTPTNHQRQAVALFFRAIIDFLCVNFSHRQSDLALHTALYDWSGC